jgi:hypothetical protein
VAGRCSRRRAGGRTGSRKLANDKVSQVIDVNDR